MKNKPKYVYGDHGNDMKNFDPGKQLSVRHFVERWESKRIATEYFRVDKKRAV